MSPLPLLVTDTFWELAGEEARQLVPRVEPVLLGPDRQLDLDVLGRVEIACLSGDAYPTRVRALMGACARAENLRWLHSFSAGVDSPAFTAVLERGVRLTNSSGASAPSIARTVTMYLLALSRDLPAWTAAQRERRWAPRRYEELIGQRLLMVGWGPIGQETARLAEALGLEVEICRRAADGTEPYPVRPLAGLRDALVTADWVVVALPLTPDTRGLFGVEEFAAMRPGARLVNVGRGELIDEPALVSALATGHLGGAALDVFATEPLPETSELWAMPNVIITPHASGITDRTDARGRAIFLDNLERYAAGTPLRNEVRLPSR